MSGQLREELVFKGLITNPNELAVAGDGAMREFTNMMLFRPGLAQKRRGIIRIGPTSNPLTVNKLFNYDGGRLLHSGRSTAGLLKQFSESSGVITPYSTSAIVPYNSTGRVRGCISGKNFYLAGSVPWRLSGLDSTPVAAGGIYAPGFDRLATTFPAGSLLPTQSSFAYRSVFGLTDAKDNLILGAPSGRFIVTNLNSTASSPGIRIIIPSIATTSHFIQLYRSSTVAVGTEPDDNLQLVYERQLTALDISAGYFDFTDITPEAARGAFIYTAPGQEGIDAANLAPPGCSEVCDFQNRTWYANTARPLEFVFSIIAIGGSAGIQPGDTINAGLTFAAVRDFEVSLSRVANVTTGETTEPHGYAVNDVVMIAGDLELFGHGPFTIATVADSTHFTYSETASAAGPVVCSVYKEPAFYEYLTTTIGSVSYNNQITALNLVSAINKRSGNSLWAEWISAPDDLDQGKILLRGMTPASAQFQVTVGQGGQRDCFLPQLLPDSAVMSLSRTTNVVTATMVSGTHSFKAGEQFSVLPAGLGSGISVFGTGPFTVLAAGLTTNAFTYAENGNDGTLAGQTVFLTVSDASLPTAEVKPNRIYYSKSQKHEAVPRFAYVDVGAADTRILAMKAQRGQIWVWKTDGIFRLRGYSPDNIMSDLTIEAIDTSLRVLATESIQLFDNRCFGLTDRGVVAISESGLEVVSSAIDNDLRLMVSGVADAAVTASTLSLEQDCFATAYETQHSYILHVPSFAATDVDVLGEYGSCRYAYVLTLPPSRNGGEGTWAMWDWGLNLAGTVSRGKRCAEVSINDDKLYLGDGYNGWSGESYVYKERKTTSPAADCEDECGTTAVASLTRTSGTTVVGTTTGSNPFRLGDRIRITPGSANFPTGIYVVSARTPTTFTIAGWTGSNVTLAAQTVILNVPVVSSMTWLLMTAGAAGREKRWDELEFIFAPTQLAQAAAFTESQVAFSLTLSNELSTATHTIATQATQIARVWIDTEMARGSRLLVRIQHSAVGELFNLSGIAVSSEVLGGAVTR